MPLLVMVLKMGGRCSGGAKFASGNGVGVCEAGEQGVKGGMVEGGMVEGGGRGRV